MEPRGDAGQLPREPEAAGPGGGLPQLQARARLQGLLLRPALAQGLPGIQVQAFLEKMPLCQEVLAAVCGTTYPRTERILWLNMRQEPSLYINGEPACARPPNKAVSSVPSA